MAEESDSNSDYTPYFERASGMASSSEVGSIPTESIDADSLADALISLGMAFLYNHSDDSNKLVIWIMLESEEQKQLIQQEHYKTVIIRQATFFEYLLNARIEQFFYEQKGESLSNKERGYIWDGIGNGNRPRVASMLGLLTENEEKYLQELMATRNKLAHTPWISFSDDNEKQFERIATKVYEVLEDFSQNDEVLAQASERAVDRFED